MTALVVLGLVKRFGGVRALERVSFRAEPKTILGLIGPNGAGKTTALNLVSGLGTPDAGTITFEGEELTKLPPAGIAALGIARTFQNIRLFARLTVRENLLAAFESERRASLFEGMLRMPRSKEDEERAAERAAELSLSFGLDALHERLPGELSYGHQRRLEIARAMMLRPKLLLLDEPAAGMNSAEARALGERIVWLRATFGVAVVLVEHNVSLVMETCDRIHVLDHGVSIADGTPAEIRSHPEVIRAYLGGDEEATVAG